MEIERYRGVRGEWRVQQIENALEACHVEILKRADPSSAPFEFTIRVNGEVVDLVCYAFTANRYEQGERPSDEHRFQVKYGSEFKRLHHLYVDESRSRITLMFGVHDSLPLFIAVDPAMHNPTWFSSSVEFKDDDLREAVRLGWHGWERDRVSGGRRRAHPRDFQNALDERVETVVAFRPEHFLSFVMFERIATAMDPGERLLLSDRISERVRSRRPAADLLQWVPDGASKPAALRHHPLLAQLGLTADELFAILAGSFRLLVAVRGSVAEFHLEKILQRVAGVTSVQRIDADGQPDFAVEFKHRPKMVRIECKNVLRRISASMPRVDFQKTRASKRDPCSRYYDPSQFEVLAACLHAVTENWEFRYSQTATLPLRTGSCSSRIATNVQVDLSVWPGDPGELLDMLSR